MSEKTILKKSVSEKAMELIEKNNQKQLLKYVDELDNNKINKLSNQIENLDFSILNKTEYVEKRGKFEPIDAVTIDMIEKNHDKYEKIGLKAIHDGKVAAVLLAGGQGSRLGFDKPKGMFNIGVDKTLYIFECHMKQLIKVSRQAGTWIPIYIMTSHLNNSDTVNFFEEKNYFGYDKNFVKFFIQDQLPALDENGKMFLSDKDTVCTAPNGNGGWFASMIKNNLISDIEKNNIEWINVFAVDNVLQKSCDPVFIGSVIDSKKTSGSKVVRKTTPEEKVGVMCLENGKPSIVEYYELDDKMRNMRDESGNLCYTYGVILNYLFNIKELKEQTMLDMPLHKAHKKISYLDENGNIVKPEKPNAYKFETLILDMIKNQKSCLLYEVEREKEFAPVKNKTGVDSVDTARELLRKNGVEI